MPKINNLEELKKLREKSITDTAARKEGKFRVIIGLGTCGIAAGGRKIMEAAMEEISKRGLKDVSVETTGCIGMCQNEPLMDIVRPGEPRVTYGNLKPEDVPRIIADHLVNGNVVEEKVIGRPE
ncbi:MAG: (2Fe-2S) ferredoxin domain-containing protein [Synergistaceae bacterium]|jgi:NADP-reducing hydrogenase subunit HndB|nr:(2Fe-2S) ferredoxin domain-containing protein [Synergistaceae bacterium]MDD3672333.1 (2Fe-2S) ferredoxin domain-containing protein [Synergistaceae bacterium]MDD3963761.1 (2Fe-2S) ferredoxin domain-containing protein [Synergistaceae bacterium]MDD4704909.1 (2Fe-2S) ferredoxin domain-containing protein [Synergistaceae bacterium]MDD4750891.1 (2Fe-2S) ferredoxin domain-containing protein [Synergistaceae bacterium]